MAHAGLGLEPVMKALLAAGCKTFFVAHTCEGVRARAISATARIFILNGWEQNNETIYIQHALIPVIGNPIDMRRWNDVSLQRGMSLPAAIQINIGMNRLGLDPQQISDLQAGHGLNPVLILGHFSSSEDINSSATRRERHVFAQIRAEFPDIPASLANSSGHFLTEMPKYDLTRAGYALYGGNPTPHLPNPMRSVVTLQAPILQLRKIEAGETVGYNTLWTAKRPTHLATCSIGYADGLPRAARGTDASRGAIGYFNGVPCPILGNISMDLTIFDVTDTAATLGDLIEILGTNQSIDQLGAASGTIGYEILTRLGPRYQRHYLQEN